MFIGHLAVALAEKKVAPKVPLWVLLTAALWIDLIWPIFLLLGLETVRIDPGNTQFTPLDFVSYPYTHSLFAVFGWALLLGLAYLAKSRDRIGAFWVGLAVMSHWILDWVTHRPDLPLTPGDSTRVGLGLWNSVPATMLLEITLFLFGIWMHHVRSFAFWSFTTFMLIMYFANAFGPPPPSEKALAYFALLSWLIPLWGYWIDRVTRAERRPIELRLQENEP